MFASDGSRVRSFSPEFLRQPLAVALLAALALGAAPGCRREAGGPPPDGGEAAGETKPTAAADGADELVLPRASWEAASLEVGPARRAPFAKSVALTGKVTLDEDHVAHVFPLVDGRVDEVKVQFGQKVRKGELLVVVQSKEVGQLMLQLYQDRLQLEFVATKDRWTQAVSKNTQAMIELMRQASPIETIEKQLHERPMGEYRDKLMSAYIGHYRAKKHLERLAPLTQEGAVTGKQLLEAEAEANATRATLQSLAEQLDQDSRQASIVSAQSVKELQTRVAVDETSLKILGFHDDALGDVDPVKQGETISHYPIYSPFDGTIISKDVVLLERVGPERQILSIADLSTVWVSTDIYEEHLPLLERLEGRTLRLRSAAWPDKTFEARVFYTGDVVDEATRTLAMRAVADNRDGLLKPGMFVSVELPQDAETAVLQVPVTAVLDHEGRTFVFVHRGGDKFARRDVRLGRRSADMVEILAGLEADEPIAVRGGFALKSRMLAELLAE